MQKLETKVCTCLGQEQRCAHAEVGDRGMHILRSETKVCTC